MEKSKHDNRDKISSDILQKFYDLKPLTKLDLEKLKKEDKND